MANIRLVLDRQESYCLLVAQEYLRQMMVTDEGGIPLIASISPLSISSASTSVKFVLHDTDEDYVLEVLVNAGDLWPKQGIAHLMVSGLMEAETGVLRQEFELRGNPANPQVVFTAMRGGG